MTQAHETTIQVYTFIQEYIDENGFAPSQREMATGCYLSHSGVTRHLDRLEAWGCIHRKPGQARGISLTGKAPPQGPAKSEQMPGQMSTTLQNNCAIVVTSAS